jgi:diguanylate cyclase (GGDEF)-like protein
MMSTPFEKLENIFLLEKELPQKELFTLFDAIQVPKEDCWRTIYRLIFDVKIDFDSTLDRKIARTKLEPIMKKALRSARDKVFSEKTLLDLIKDYNTASFSVCHNQLTDVLNVLGDLTKEFTSMSVKRYGKVKKLELDTVSVLESDLSIDDKIKSIKSKFKIIINKFQEDLVKLNQMNHTDHLTGLSNRRFFDKQLNIEVVQALEERTWLNLLMIDIDDFKLFNDTYGHPLGDQALKIVAKNIRIACHDASSKMGIEFFPTRYGGEEFTIILPAVDKKEALDIAEIIQTKISDYTFVIRNKKGMIKHENLKLTVSIGLATLNHKYDKKQGINALVQDADAAMFEAKKAGKNCIKTE